jgi:hypothetical protein
MRIINFQHHAFRRSPMFGCGIAVFGFGIECPVFGFPIDVFGFGI